MCLNSELYCLIDSIGYLLSADEFLLYKNQHDYEKIYRAPHYAWPEFFPRKQAPSFTYTSAWIIPRFTVPLYLPRTFFLSQEAR